MSVVNATLVTGADGYIGRRLVSALLETTSEPLILAVRADGPAELAAKRQACGWADSRVTVRAVDLSTPDPFAGIDPAGIGRIVHAAAKTSFTVDRDTAQAVNVDGTIRVRDFAATCPDLTRFVALSTLYAVGATTGTVLERPGDGASFVNHYEWSKWAAEQQLLAPGAPPVVIARLPTVIADDDSGTVTQYNAFHNTLKLYFYGLMSLLPGDAATVLSLATAEFVVDAVRSLLKPEVPAGIYHVSPDAADCTTLGAAVDPIYAAFSADPGFRKRRVLEPVLVGRDSFADLVEAATVIRGGPIADALGSITPFAEQLYLPKVFDNTGLRARWPGYRAPDPIELIESVGHYLAGTRWGRSPLTERRLDVPAR
ncbi:SDR family oxidoreductase [Nocardia stercoris]|uniref:SDR family oxidoreductase n=1 Tax=Nocardia stercoris TaxID=2483361 RepID=UPI00131A07B3|nr:SDR family oxidoreductase [Nocardia stercoris]